MENLGYDRTFHSPLVLASQKNPTPAFANHAWPTGLVAALEQKDSAWCAGDRRTFDEEHLPDSNRTAFHVTHVEST